MIFGRETETGSITDLCDMRDYHDFQSSCLDVEAWEAEAATGAVGDGLPLLAVVGDGLPENKAPSTKNKEP